MNRDDKSKDQAERAEAYQRGLIALSYSVMGFRDLTGVDLTADIDISGRRMGQTPYIKLTAQRLAEITRLMDGMECEKVVAELSSLFRPDEDTNVVSIDPKIRVEASARRLVFEAYRPADVKR